MAKALTGMPLLLAIAAGTATRITQEQFKSLDASHVEVNTADTTKEGALVRLTEAGAAAAKAAGETQAPAAKGGIEIDDDVPMPTGARRSPRETLYPFEALAVGQSFHVAKTAENPDPATRLSSSVSGAHVRFSPVINGDDGKPVMEEYQSPVYKRTEDGKGYVKGDDGKRVIERMDTKTREKRGEPERQFRIVSVGADDKRGEGARVFRVK